uniref:Extracellular ligand-gated ion channel n=1 Tax=Solanum tuberosum TaxID=4113 RepID=M1C122_SOLTU
MCVDQSDTLSTVLSWFVFIIFAIVVPCLSHFLLACADCDANHDRPYDNVVQLSLSGVAALSFICLTRFMKKFGLRRFLFLDKLCDESETVRKCYMEELNRSLKILFIFVLPCFAAESIYKIWWYSSGGTQIPFLGNVIILRLRDFSQIFHIDSDVETVLREHLRIRRHLRIISHRYRRFILLGLVFVTASQFASLLMTTRSTADLHIYKSGELALCSLSLLAGLLILLRGAVRITHKAQAVTCLAAKWHVCATVDSFEAVEGETPPISQIASNQVFPVTSEGSSDADDVGDEEDEFDNTKFVHSYAYSTISFQKRQALVTYFEHNRAGITLYGFMLDRSYLHTIFGMELALVLWLLGKTVASIA